MFAGILQKFRQHRDIAYKLIETTNKKIAEATIDEYYWGIGKDKSGKNVIGDILVNVRKRIKEEILDTIIWNYFMKKSVELVKIGCNVILDWGFWTSDQRRYITEYYKSHGI